LLEREACLEIPRFTFAFLEFFPGRDLRKGMVRLIVFAGAALILPACGGNGSPSPLDITTTSLSSAVVGTPYSQTLAAEGGTAPHRWTILSGTLPAWVKLSPAGILSGTPGAPTGAFAFTLRVTDAATLNADRVITLNVVPGLFAPQTSTSPPGRSRGTGFLHR